MIGRKLNQYEITARIGEGGMGEVFRARDAQLERDVAIKILPRELSADPERVARFEREARTLASLQHPNIAAVHGFEQVEGVRFLAMELVEGTNLAERMQQGALAEEEAREIFRAIGEGLAEAHRNQIVHRDLKPANVMITPEGAVKILDFGLARAYSGDADDGGDPALSPTITAAMTQAGTILGTAAYMAPEQARGRRVDQRADIWAMGAIFFEMLAGRRLFEGETVTDVLASVIKLEPDLDSLPSGLQPSTRRVLRRCLQKDPRRRLHSAADAVLELDEPDRPDAAEPGRSRPYLPWGVAVVLALALGAQFLVGGGEFRGPVEVREYQLPRSRGEGLEGVGAPRVSPDGSRLAIALSDRVGQIRIELHDLAEGSVRLLSPEVSGADPAWSPDSAFIAHFSGRRLRKLHVESGSVETVADVAANGSRGISWSPEGQLLFAPRTNTGLFVVDADGGPVREVTQVDSTLVDGSHRWPVFLPDGEHFLFTLWSNVLEERQEDCGIFVGDLTGAAPRRLLRDVSQAVHVPTGQILFHRNGRLLAVDFDAATLEVSGEPRLVGETVGFVASNGELLASASNVGDVFLDPNELVVETQLLWVDRAGRLSDGIGAVLPMSLNLRVGPGLRHYAVEQLDVVGSVEIWIGDFERDNRSRLSDFGSDCFGVAFSAEGREVAYLTQTMNAGQLYRHRVSGGRPPELVLEFGEQERIWAINHWPRSDLMLADVQVGETGTAGIYAIDSEAGQMRPLLVAGYDQVEARLSPDGRWLAYSSEETGRSEVYVRNWPELDRKWQVSRSGGRRAAWSKADGRLMFLDSGQSQWMEVAFDGSGDDPRIGLPDVVTNLPPAVGGLDFSPDHQRVLMGLAPNGEPTHPLRVLTGWGRALR